MKTLLGIIFTFISIMSFASSCIHGEDEVVFLSEKHEDSVVIEFLSDSDEIDVKVTAPKEIEGAIFNKALLVRGNIKSLNFDYMFNLHGELNGNNVVITYMVKNHLLGDSTIQLLYGAVCGPLIQYKVRT